MIIRLMGEGQYEIDKKHLDAVNKIDNNIVKIVSGRDEKAVATAFKTEYKKLSDYVRKNGKKIPQEVLKPSDIIIPPADLTLEEARQIFKGDGLIPE
jgi:phage regulator Rha-like protein